MKYLFISLLACMVMGCRHDFERQYEMQLEPLSEDCDSANIIICIDKGKQPEQFLLFYHRLQDTAYAEDYARVLTVNDQKATAMFVDPTTKFYKKIKNLFYHGFGIDSLLNKTQP